MPFAPYEWMLALRYLRARRRESFISIISGFSLVGIALGVATLIIVMAVMNGFRIELMSKILGLNGHIVALTNAEEGINDYAAAADRLREIDGVTRVAPMIEGQVMASGSGRNSGVLVRGYAEDDLKGLMDGLADDEPAIVFGSLDNLDEMKGIVIGARLARNLGVFIGDNLTLISPKGAVTPFGVTPRIKAYPVVAIFEIGMSEYDSAFVFMPLSQAQLYFNKPDAVTHFEMMVEEVDRVDDPAVQVQGQIEQPVFVQTWQQTNASFFGALQVERNVMFLILTLIILVAALNIVSGLIMLVKDKGHDIAILRSMGATKGAIMRIFFITGSFIGVVGTLIGLLIGVLFCQNIEAIRSGLSDLLGVPLFDPVVYFLAEMPADMQNEEVIAVVVMALTISFIATLYPSWRAANLDPVEAMRYE